MKHGEPGTECCFAAIRKYSCGHAAGRERCSYRTASKILPVINPCRADERPFVAQANDILSENSDDPLTPSGCVICERSSAGGGEQLLIAGSNHLQHIRARYEGLGSQHMMPQRLP